MKIVIIDHTDGTPQAILIELPWWAIEIIKWWRDKKGGIQ